MNHNLAIRHLKSVGNLILILLIPIVFTLKSAYGSDSLVVGNSLPEISFHNVKNFESETAKLSDFRGKIVILDFWATWCTPCIANLPKMEALQKEYEKEIQIILVNNELPNVMESLFSRMEKAGLKVNLISETINANLFDVFNVSTLPHYVWISQEGVYLGASNSEEVNSNNIASILNGKKLSFRYSKHKSEDPNDNNPTYSNIEIIRNGLFIREQDQTSLRYHSLLTGYLNGLASVSSSPRAFEKTQFEKRRITIYNAPIVVFFKIAFGKNDVEYPTNRILFEFADSVQYKLLDHRDKNNLFSYDLILPKPDIDLLYNTMQSDLKRAFFLEGNIEKRRVKCYVLTHHTDISLEASSTNELYNENLYEIEMRNQPISRLLAALNKYQQKPVLDETGITHHIDVTLNAKLNDIDAVNEVLSKYGLVLEEREAEIDVLVISDEK